MKKVIRNYINFYKENIKERHIVCMIVAILLMIFFLTSGIYKYKHIDYEVKYDKMPYLSQLKENTMLNFFVIFAGITPYCFLSIFGFYQIYIIVNKIVIIYVVGGSVLKLILYIIIGVIASISYTLCIATGLYYCKLSSKRYTYSQRKSFNLNDFKISIYKLRKKEEKVKECEEKKMKRLEKIKELDVKIPYLNLVISYILSMLIILITCIF